MNFNRKIILFGVFFLLAGCTNMGVYEGFCGSSLYHKPGCVYAPVGYTDDDYGQDSYRVTYTMFQEYGEDVVFQNFHRRSMELCSSGNFPGYNLNDFLFEATTIYGGGTPFGAFRASGVVNCTNSPAVRSVADLPRSNATRTAGNTSRASQSNIGATPNSLTAGLQCRSRQDQCNAACAGDQACIGACFQAANSCIASSARTGTGSSSDPSIASGSNQSTSATSLPGQALPANDCIQFIPLTKSPDEMGIFTLVIRNICDFPIYVGVEMLTDKGNINKTMCVGAGKTGAGTTVPANEYGECTPGGRPAKGDYREGPPWNFTAYRNTNPDDDKECTRNIARREAYISAGRSADCF